ncbi:hypothetical protein ACOMHN_043387 [Nucella lapillus]
MFGYINRINALYQYAVLFNHQCPCSLCGVSSGTLWTDSPLVSDCTLNGDHLMESLLKTTSASCAMECLQREWCNSFHYTRLVRLCRLCSLHYLDSDVIIDRGLTKYFRSTSEACAIEEGLVWDRQSGLCVGVVMSGDQLVRSWKDAQHACSSQNLTLASLHTPQRLEFLVRFLRHNDRFENLDFFIGAARPSSSWGKAWAGSVSDLQWVSNGAILNITDSKYWASGQPDNRLNHDNVVVLKFEDKFHLSDGPANASYGLGYVCEKSYQ